MPSSFSNCPECGYSLNGLPARHRCPECGFEYDEQTRVWKPSSPGYVYFAVMITFGAAWIQLLVHSLIFASHGFRGWMDGICFVIFIPVTAVIAREILRAFHANQRGRYVAIGPRALHIRTTTETVIIPWERIQSVACDWKKLSQLSVVSTTRLSIEVDNDADRNALKPILFSNERASSIGAIIPQMERPEFAAAVNKVLRKVRGRVSDPQQESGAANHPTAQ